MPGPWNGSSRTWSTRGFPARQPADVLNLGGSERHGYTEHMSQDLIAIGG